MRIRRSTGLALAVTLALASLAPAARAWTPATRARMTIEAVGFMPASLRLALDGYREAILRGALEAMTEEDAPAHRPPWDSGTLDQEVASRADALIRSVRERAPFHEVARRFGELAHFVADTGFPPNAGGPTGAARYAHFAELCESRREKFPLVFYGHEEPFLSRGDFRGFAQRALERARSEDRELARAYAAAGDTLDGFAFDDRSVPFAVASLSYSHTVTDIVRAWLAAWRRAEGDLGRTPYLETLSPPEHEENGP